MQQIKFRQWLYENGLNVSGFCKFMEINRSTFYRWMDGTFDPDAVHMLLIKKLSRGLFVRPEDLRR